MSRFSRRAIATAAVCVGALYPPCALAAHAPSATASPDAPAQRAWPAAGGADKPASSLARWLATQVGAAPTVHVHRYRGALERLAGQAAAVATAPFATTRAPAAEPLSLVRSYAIPADDPLAVPLANLSWTYDSAISAQAFAQTGDLAQARQLLDQLQALQHHDGAIEFAFNTATGQSMPLLRAGTIASVGLAAMYYRSYTCDGTYDELAYRAANWLLGEQVSDHASPGYGLIRGGPDVSWISTQHNLIARALFASLIDAIRGRLVARGAAAGAGRRTCPGGLAGASAAEADAFARRLHQARALLDAGVVRELFVPAGAPSAAGVAATAYFREGVGDDTRPIDAQALGILWLLSRGDRADALAVAAYADQTMLMSDRTIALSADPITFNETYTSSYPFVGYRPYAEPEGPDLLWMEGTLEMRFAKARLGESTQALDASIAAWQNVSGADEGPLMADEAVAGTVFDEYHAWPAAAPAAWELLNRYAFTLLDRP
ncbi:MAG: hypothetical protein ABSG43_02170 [Solirubrobacteraceae bacterium]